jgi:excisionase family DNA binding protein
MPSLQLPGDLPEVNGTCLNDASISRIVQRGSATGHAVDLGERGGQGRDRTADLAVFSQVSLIRVRSRASAWVAFALLSGDGGPVIVRVEPGLSRQSTRQARRTSFGEVRRRLEPPNRPMAGVQPTVNNISVRAVPSRDNIRFSQTRQRVGVSTPEGCAVAAQPSSTTTTTEAPGYLRTAEVADILHVSPKTVSRWAKESKLPFLRTLGGHRRYPAAAIRQLADELQVRPTA